VAAAVAGADTAPVVADRHLDLAVAVVHDDFCSLRLRVLDRVRQTFLNEPIRREVDTCGKLEGLSFDSQVDLEPRLTSLLDEPVEMLQARLGSERGSFFGPTQHSDHPTHLGQCLSARSLDDQQGLALAFLVGPEQPAHAGCLHRHDADAVTDDVVQLARNPRPFLCHGSSRTLLALPLGPRGAVLGFVGFLELPPQHEADEPDDREDEPDEDEVADASLRVRSFDHGLGADDDRKPGDRLPPIAKQGDEEGCSTAGEEDDEVGRDEAVVEETREDDGGADRDQRPERKAAPDEQRRDDRHDQHDVEPRRPMWAVIGPALSDGVRDPEPETQEDECVEPVLPETPEPLHVLKVLRFRADRLGREDESQILRGDDVKSASRPKTSGAGSPSVISMTSPAGGHMDTPLVIETSGLTKRFGERTAVANVDLRVPRGAAFGYLGPNGAGKTTLIRMLLGLTQATAGTMQLLGHSVPEERSVALARVGAIVEEPRFHAHLTGRENLSVIAAAREPEAHARIDGALVRVGLTHRADERVKRYSLGMRQRLGVARSLLADPELLILDEPTNGLDPAGIHEFRDMIRGFVAEGRTVLLSSHLLDEVEKICDEVAIVDRGRVVAQGPIADLAAGGKHTILIATSDEERALSILSDHRAVESVSPEASGLRVTLLPDDGAAGDDISRRLVLGGLAIRRFEPARVSLEQRFLEITSRLEEAA
jgi:ABC-2 type transport system ATP-binding protein